MLLAEKMTMLSFKLPESHLRQILKRYPKIEANMSGAIREAFFEKYQVNVSEAELKIKEIQERIFKRADAIKNIEKEQDEDAVLLAHYKEKTEKVE